MNYSTPSVTGYFQQLCAVVLPILSAVSYYPTLLFSLDMFFQLVRPAGVFMCSCVLPFSLNEIEYFLSGMAIFYDARVAFPYLMFSGALDEYNHSS